MERGEKREGKGEGEGMVNEKRGKGGVMREKKEQMKREEEWKGYNEE